MDLLGRGAPRGGRGGRGGGRGGGKTVVIEPHRHAGVFIARGKEDALVTLNLVPGEAVYGEKRISIDNKEAQETNGVNGEAAPVSTAKIEYRVWNPFRLVTVELVEKYKEHLSLTNQLAACTDGDTPLL